MSTKNLIDPKEIQKLEILATEIREINKILHLGTKSLTPLNYKEELEKFNSSASYNPIYLYKNQNLPDVSKKIDGFKVRLEKIAVPDDLKNHIFEYLEDKRGLYITKKSIGTESFSENVHRLFDWGSDRLDLLLTNTPKVEFKLDITHFIQDAKVIKKRFEKALKKYEITSFKVKINEFSPHIIYVGYRSVHIGNEIKRFECNVDRLIVHEIESHVLQMENTKRTATPLAELTKYGNQILYGEGLAIHNEISTRKITPSAYEMYFYRIKAVRLLDKSFREIYETLCENLDPNRAFVMTYRVKRGLKDTAEPGGFPKDASYLLGYHEIENLIRDGYPLKLLYATKTPVLSSLLHKYGIIDLKKVLIPKN